MKKGSLVKVVQPIIQGSIIGVKYDDENDIKIYRVAYTAPDGTHAERDFLEAELEVVSE